MQTISELMGLDESEQITKQCICAECSAEFTETFPSDMARFYTGDRYCDPCSERQVAEETAKRDEALRNNAILDRKESWARICPPLYLDTDLRHTGLSKAVLNALAEWDWKKGYGIGLVGTSGKGKTRCAFAKLNRIHMAGDSVYAISAKKLERFVQNSFSDDASEKRNARENLKKCRTASVLFIDDIGKEKYTERVASEFYDLIEHRTAQIMPILWTSNSTLDQLCARMGEDHSEPTLRRLQQFSHIVNADGQPTKLDYSDKPTMTATICRNSSASF